MTATLPTAQPDVEATAGELVTSLRDVVDAIPDGPHSPTTMARRLGLSRVTMSKLLGALERSTPFDVLERMPGPDSLRDFVLAAGSVGVNGQTLIAAETAIGRFDGLIRERFGTRAALHAAIGGQSATLRSRIDQAARAEVFKGMRQIIGVETDTWLSSMMFVPSATDPEAVAVTVIHGALGMRRLRPDTPVTFTFGPPYHEPGVEPSLSQSPISLQELYTNEPATLEVQLVGGQLLHRLVDSRLGKDALADMLAISHTARGSRRYASEESALRGVSIYVDIPARTLVCDAIVHRDLFPGSEPRLIVYNPGARGPSNPNDRKRDIDRIPVTETVATIPDGPGRFDVVEVPNYEAMIERVCKQIGKSPDEFRVYRLRMAYPVVGFQIVVAFVAPVHP